MILTAAVSAVRAATAFQDSPLGPAVAAAFIATDDHDDSKGNQLAIMSGGYDALLLRVHLIRQARTSIDVQTFIWTNDECGRLLMCELIEAARRGGVIRGILELPASGGQPGSDGRCGDHSSRRISAICDEGRF